jgi:addiction module HigA family antidote
MKTASEIQPTTLFHPGVVLNEEISFRGLMKKEISRQIGISPSVLSEIISGKRSITPRIAIRLEDALGINALFFLNMQSRYDYYTLKGKLRKLSQHKKIKEKSAA